MRQMEELQKDLEGDYESTLASAQATERRLSDIEKERDVLLREADGHDENTTSLRLKFEKETEALKQQVDELQGRLREAEKEREAIVSEADQDRRRQGEEIKSARLKSEEATSKLEEDVRRLKRHMDQLQDQLRESDLANAQLKREIELANAQLKRESDLANAQLKRDSANADKLLVRLHYPSYLMAVYSTRQPAARLHGLEHRLISLISWRSTLQGT
jgi:DNA repair exonuclease SbcCD ATPase subunit